MNNHDPVVDKRSLLSIFIMRVTLILTVYVADVRQTQGTYSDLRTNRLWYLHVVFFGHQLHSFTS